ncbi:hypothetical protein BS78_02G020300 [Paspalum vaginatum]|nr:hypothetical protein BS78_02G020300 [Paspalum vaginatum]
MGLSEMLGSALVQEAVSRVVSCVLGKRKERASQAQGHKDNMERLDMAILGMESALEMSANHRGSIINVSLLQTRKKIECAYVQAKELQDKQKLLKAGDVPRFERFADWAHKFVGDVECARSLSRNNLCNNSIIVRHLLQGRRLMCHQLVVQGNQRRSVDIFPFSCSEERGFEAVLFYSCKEDDSTPMQEGKTFSLMLILRLSGGSTDIVGVAIKGLQYLASQFKLVAAESAAGELTLLPTLLRQGIAPSHVPWEVDALPQFLVTPIAQYFRPDPACCRASRLGLCTSNSNDDVSSELSHVFPEEVIWFSFRCYISAAVEPPNSRSMGWTPPPLAVSVFFTPHYDEPWAMQHGSHAMVRAGGDYVVERRDGSLQQGGALADMAVQVSW